MNRKTIVLIDNYDSFTYNIYQMVSSLLVEESGLELKVFRNDEIAMEDLVGMAPAGLIISPGPGLPADAGISVDAVRQFAGKIPILGICLGHQAIAEAFGAKIIQAKSIVHGKSDAIIIDGKGVLRNLSNPCLFTRYHSLAVDAASLPEELEVSAWAEDGEIMGLRHREWIVEGVQFHPESIGSPQGERLLANFLHWRRNPLESQRLLSKVISGADLEQDEAAAFMNELTEGNLTEAVIAGMLTALAAKGYCPEELAGFASVLVEKCRPVEMEKTDLLDTCGTGGDGRHTFNISSFSALIAAACGAKVAKHGNRSVSSKSGSTDFFNALGIPTDMSPASATACLAEEGFAYFAAPLYHGSMRYAGPVRQALKVKTIMNCIGPLANPAGAAYRIIGVYDETLLPM
ncbi:MAG: anthranilate phosphoribosyltransferase, partial [spirochete symbiont of Stewartia floridana]